MNYNNNNNINTTYFRPSRTGTLHLETDGSSTEDFRGVIDDLTVQNKKLKKRLRRYEKLHDAHLKEEKLFEVRVHGLPVAKKRELEAMLQKFALDLSESPDQLSTSAPNHTESGAPGLRPQKTTSSHVSNFTDSAYASASASGQGSSAQSGSGAGSSKHPFKPSAVSRHSNIQSYLHDIPEGLLPKHPSAMTEKTKKKLVVRRLEQIFAGKGAATGGHQHPLQQQEVSWLATEADRSATEAGGQRAAAEGMREARIMKYVPVETAERKDLSPSQTPLEHTSSSNEAIQNASHANQTSERDFADKTPSSLASSPDQRPTRPLDLDPHRAQVPVENLEYIRHLGFSPPGAEFEHPNDDHGWIYLNLLVNMAQLHTINVTADFVKSSLQEYSDKFELSHDGRKVRWRGGSSMTRTSSEAGYYSSTSNTSPDGTSNRKRQKTSHPTSAYSDSRNHVSRQKQLSEQKKLSYTPMFFHRSSDDSDLSSSEDDDEMMRSPWFAPQATGNSSGMTGSGTRANSGIHPFPAKKIRARDDGPIIFYNNAKFCTDLSGDNKTEAAMMYNPIMYHVASTQPLGAPIHNGSAANTFEGKGPLDNAQELPEPMDLDDNPIASAQEIQFPAQTPMTSGSEKTPLEMEVSGVGGVYPADNFSINVRTQHARADKATPEYAKRKALDRYPQRLSKMLMEDGKPTKIRSAFHKEVLSSRQRDLPPSELPPASCFIGIEDSDSEDASIDESISSTNRGSVDASAPSAAALQQLQRRRWTSDESDDEVESNAEDDEESDDGSMDMLATARGIDPESILAREREYDAEMAERMADDIPAGSSAATAAGGSGFASPASDVDPAEIAAVKRAHKQRQVARQAPALLTVPRLGKSMGMNGHSN